MATGPWLSTDSACAYLGCTRKALYDHVEDGHITWGRLGRLYRFSQPSLDACIEAGRTPQTKRKAALERGLKPETSYAHDHTAADR